jgi:RNA polymerase sigma factor (sigma-70 family)
MELEAMADLGTRLAKGDSGAVEDMYGALGPRVLSYLRRLVPYDEAEDVMQRVFFEVWRGRDRFDPDRSLEAWVFAIARRRAIDHLRRPHHVTVPIELVRDLADADADGREVAESLVWAREVRRCLDRLPAEQREVLELAYFGGRTQVEIAEQLGLPLGTVKARMFRGLRRMGHAMGIRRG